MQPDPGRIRAILASAKTIAVVGLSDKPHRPSHGVAAYLKDAGYRIIPVNPLITEVLGERAYANLRDVPDRIDIVDVFRRPEFVPALVDDAIAVGARAVWMQLRIVHEAAARKAREAGLAVVMNACIMTTHASLFS